MLLKEKHCINLKETIKKINSFSTAYNNTYVLSAVVQPGKSQAIIHLNEQGEIIRKYDYNCIIGTFGMLRDKEVIVLNTSNATIDIINLETQYIRHVNHQYMLEDADLIQIVTFYDTKYFCIIEHGDSEEQRFKLTYYNYNTEFEKSDPISVYEQDHDSDRELAICKVNDHSKIAWFFVDQEQNIQFNTWDLKQVSNGKKSTIFIRNSLNDQYGVDNLELFIHNMWQIREDVYTLVCTNNRENNFHNNDLQNKAISMLSANNSNYIVDVRKETIRETTYMFIDQQTKDIYNQYIVDTFNLGAYSVFHIYHKTSQCKISPLFFVNNQEEKAVQMDYWEDSCYANFYVPGYDTAKLITAYYDNGNVQEIQVEQRRMAEKREVALHFMLHLNEDFDDDLLQDAIELLQLI